MERLDFYRHKQKHSGAFATTTVFGDMIIGSGTGVALESSRLE